MIRLAQVESHQLLTDGQTQAAGRVLGTLGAKGLNTSARSVFGSAKVAAADREMITSVHVGAEATLDIGSISSGPDLPARLMPRRLNRHTSGVARAGRARRTRWAFSLRRCFCRRSCR